MLVRPITRPLVTLLTDSIRETGLPWDEGVRAARVSAVAAPTNTVAPVASGTMSIGQTVSTTDGTWTGSPAFTYQWRRDGASIGSATSSSYVLTSSDIGPAIDCVVTGTNAGGNASADSNDLQYTPALLTTLRGWYRADLGITLVGSDVDQWADQSGNSNHLAAPAAGNRPAYLSTGGANSQACVQFAASKHLRKTLFDAGGTWGSASYFVVILAENSGTRAMCDYQSTSRFGMFVQNTTNFAQTFSGGSSNVFSTSTTTATSAWRLWVGTCTDGGSQFIYRGTTQEDTDAEGWQAGGPNDDSTLFVGCDVSSGSTGVGRIAEIGMMRAVMSSTERSDLAAYVTYRYGG